ncbi:MAG: type secretion system protein [Candidatus Peribacteria bacterium]|nr:type secretion system protein [Candidatus Peribacteria bacterium]
MSTVRRLLPFLAAKEPLIEHADVHPARRKKKHTRHHVVRPAGHAKPLATRKDIKSTMTILPSRQRVKPADRVSDPLPLAEHVDIDPEVDAFLKQLHQSLEKKNTRKKLAFLPRGNLLSFLRRPAHAVALSAKDALPDEPLAAMAPTDSALLEKPLQETAFEPVSMTPPVESVEPQVQSVTTELSALSEVTGLEPESMPDTVAANTASEEEYVSPAAEVPDELPFSEAIGLPEVVQAAERAPARLSFFARLRQSVQNTPLFRRRASRVKVTEPAVAADGPIIFSSDTPAATPPEEPALPDIPAPVPAILSETDTSTNDTLSTLPVPDIATPVATADTSAVASAVQKKGRPFAAFLSSIFQKNIPNAAVGTPDAPALPASVSFVSPEETLPSEALQESPGSPAPVKKSFFSSFFHRKPAAVPPEASGEPVVFSAAPRRSWSPFHKKEKKIPDEAVGSYVAPAVEPAPPPQPALAKMEEEAPTDISWVDASPAPVHISDVKRQDGQKDEAESSVKEVTWANDSSVAPQFFGADSPFKAPAAKKRPGIFRQIGLAFADRFAPQKPLPKTPVVPTEVVPTEVVPTEVAAAEVVAPELPVPSEVVPPVTRPSFVRRLFSRKPPAAPVAPAGFEVLTSDVPDTVTDSPVAPVKAPVAEEQEVPAKTVLKRSVKKAVKAPKEEPGAEPEVISAPIAKQNVGKLITERESIDDKNADALAESIQTDATTSLSSHLKKMNQDTQKPAAPAEAETKKIADNVKKRLDRSKKKSGGFQEFLGAVKYLGLGKERTGIIQNLATMLNAGLPLIDSIHTLQKETKAKPIRKLLQRVVDAVESGSALWRALEAQHFFSPHAISLIRIGEEAGNLSENLQNLAAQQEKDAALSGKIKMAMIYPAIVIVLMFIIVMGLGLFVLPNLLGVLTSLNAKLPLTTVWLIKFTNMFQKYAAVMIPGIIGGALLLVILGKFTRLKVVFQWLIFKVPGIGRLARESTIARFGIILGSLLEAGVPLIEALNSLAEVTSIVSYRRFYFRLVEHVNIGDSFSKSFDSIRGSQKLLPISVQQLVATGEKSGSLAKILIKISDIYEKKANQTAEKLPIILEPMILLFIGALVGLIAFSIIVPIYSVVGSVGK